MKNIIYIVFALIFQGCQPDQAKPDYNSQSLNLSQSDKNVFISCLGILDSLKGIADLKMSGNTEAQVREYYTAKANGNEKVLRTWDRLISRAYKDTFKDSYGYMHSSFTECATGGGVNDKARIAAGQICTLKVLIIGDSRYLQSLGRDKEFAFKNFSVFEFLDKSELTELINLGYSDTNIANAKMNTFQHCINNI